MGASANSGRDSECGSVGTPVSSTSIAQSSLASRRNFKGKALQNKPLQVSTDRDAQSRACVLDRVRHIQGQSTGQSARVIERTKHFSTKYVLGGEVMPSTHACMQVRFATRTDDGQRVVVKLRAKRGSFSSSEEEREWRVSTEFMLNLPRSMNIAEIYEVLEDDKAYYVVMEKVEGQDLFETLDSEGRLSVSDCREIIRQLLAAVAELHERGIIHKDLKLENVMLDRTPRSSVTRSTSFCQNVAKPATGCASPVVKLIDFDTVEEWSPKAAQTPGGRPRQSIVGTDQYISQEAYAGNYSPASDVFALGVIAYRLLTGRFPFNSAMFDDEVGENWVGSPKMKEIQDRLKRFEINWQLAPLPVEPLACELIRAMLSVNEQDRPSASEALRHEWMLLGEDHMPGSVLVP